MRERVTLNGEKRTFTIGRSIKADVTVDDEHTAPFHASLEITPDGRIFATDLGTTNGIIVSGKRYHAARDMELTGHELQIGRTHLRIRIEQEVLSPEKADILDVAPRLHNSAFLALACVLALAAQLAYASWLVAPQDLAATMLTVLGSTALVLAIWVFVWSLLSRVMRGEWRWLRHIAISTGALALCTGASSLLSIGVYMFSLPTPEGATTWLGATALGCAVCLHLMHASSLTTRWSALIATIVAFIALVTAYWTVQRPLERDVNYIATSLHLYPPFLRLSTPESADSFFKTLSSLRDAADIKVKAAIAEDPDPEDARIGVGY